MPAVGPWKQGMVLLSLDQFSLEEALEVVQEVPVLQEVLVLQEVPVL